MGLGILVFIAEVIESASVEVDSYPWFENLIPAAMVIGILGLAVAWKSEGIGGAMAVVFAATSLLIYIATGRTKVGVVALIVSPIALPGLLFLICWWETRQIATS